MTILKRVIVRVAATVFLIASASACMQEESSSESNTDPEVLGRVNLLRAEVESAEDLSEVKRLQKAYGYYLDKGMWTDLASLFAEDATLTLPTGIYEGKESIRRHFYLNIGRGELDQMGELGADGLRDGVLNNHIIMQPVVHVDLNNTTARGRWRVMAMKADLGEASLGWAEGVYNVVYTQSEGVWRIQSLEYFEGYENSYAEGWGVIDSDYEARISNSSLLHPADRINDNACHYPSACIAPFDYQNPGASDDSNAWRSQGLTQSLGTFELEELSELLHRAQTLKDETELENLQRIFSYYLDRALWDQVTDLFADEGTVEFGQMGVYQGRSGVRSFFNSFGNQGLVEGWLFDHVQLQTIVSVDASGLTAKVRTREWGMIGYYEQEGSGRWHDGVYENTFVKEGGVWKIKSMHYYPTFVADYSDGWLEGAMSLQESEVGVVGIVEGVVETAEQNASTENYEAFPETYIPAFHYVNPVTGEEPLYPDVGRPSDAGIRINRLVDSAFIVGPIEEFEIVLSSAESLVQQVKDHHELENLENAYGYYLDKNLWNDLADLFAENGSMELAQRGAYVGRERVRGFLFNVFGDEGPVEGRLGNHLHMQPVIHVSDDGQHAKIRSRMMQQLNFTGNPSMGAAIYINEAVKEDGRWKFLSTHAFNTFTASYFGGWVENPGTRLPGVSESYPPDLPPTVEFSLFPSVYEIPFHYDNPVSGRH